MKKIKDTIRRNGNMILPHTFTSAIVRPNGENLERVIEKLVASSATPESPFKPVASLPQDGIDPSKIYLVKSGQSGESNVYAEYIYIEGKWEKLGEFQTSVDLSSYATKKEVQDKTVTSAKLIKDAEDKITGGEIVLADGTKIPVSIELPA